MSLNRFIYYSAIVGGWAAFVAWLVCEFILLRNDTAASRLQVVLVAALVGATIGGGLNLVAGFSNANWKQLLARLVPGMLCGLVGGAIGGFLGDLLFSIGVPRAVGWAIMGMGIGVAEGLYDRSKNKIRNGLIGGGLGGLVGGLLFDFIVNVIASTSGMPSRAAAFVVLGISIGALVGLVQVVLKDAWLTVVDGYRTGRQLILSAPVTVLGRGEHVAMPFLGQWGKELEIEHVRITRQPNGSFVVEDNNTRIGTRLNRQPLQGRQILKDGDVIAFGTNYVTFNERQRRSTAHAPEAIPAQSIPAPHAQIASVPRRATVSAGAKTATATAAVRTAPVAMNPDQCPKCGRTWPGTPGTRYCLVDDLMF